MDLEERSAKKSSPDVAWRRCFCFFCFRFFFFFASFSFQFFEWDCENGRGFWVGVCFLLGFLVGSEEVLLGCLTVVL